MTNFRDPTVVTQDQDTVVKLWHTVYGIFFWEFFTTLDYEWRVIRGHIPYRWTIWIYSITRVASLMSAILSIISQDAAAPLNCQLWISSELFISYLSLGTASLLIILRVIAIWNKHRVIVAVAIGVWGINIAALIQGAVWPHTVWFPTRRTCVVTNTTDNALSLISMAVTDIVLLLIMLFGLLRLRYQGGGTFPLAHLLWQQGVIWLLLATAAEVPPAALIYLNLNDPLNTMFQVPAIFTMTIAATRMHRSLVDYTSRSSDSLNESIQISVSGPKFSKTKQTYARPIPPNLMEIFLHTSFKQDRTLASNRAN